jgi:hypothetical protein
MPAGQTFGDLPSRETLAAIYGPQVASNILDVLIPGGISPFNIRELAPFGAHTAAGPFFEYNQPSPAPGLPNPNIFTGDPNTGGTGYVPGTAAFRGPGPDPASVVAALAQPPPPAGGGGGATAGPPGGSLGDIAGRIRGRVTGGAGGGGGVPQSPRPAGPRSAGDLRGGPGSSNQSRNIFGTGQPRGLTGRPAGGGSVRAPGGAGAARPQSFAGGSSGTPGAGIDPTQLLSLLAVLAQVSRAQGAGTLPPALPVVGGQGGQGGQIRSLFGGR